jgi:hypothetical protein
MSRILKVSQGDYIVQTSGEIKLSPGSTVTINGNLTVTGTTTSVSTDNTTLKDNIIVLNSGETGSSISLGSSGIQIDRGKLLTNPIAARILFDETIEHTPYGAANVGSFVLDTAIETTPGTWERTLSNLQVNAIELNTVATNGSGITFNLKDTSTVLAIEVDDDSIPYHERLSSPNQIPNVNYVTEYVSASLLSANQISTTNTDNDILSQVLSTSESIEFYIAETKVGQFKSTGLQVGAIVNLTTTTAGTIDNMSIGATTPSTGKFTSLESTDHVTLTASNSNIIAITSGSLGSINNMSIGATTPSTGKFTNVEVTTDIKIPSGTTATRPVVTSGTTPAGNLRYNTDIRSFEGWNGAIWGAVGGGLQSTPGIIIENFTALSNNLVRADSSNGSFTITLPDAPNDGDVVGVIDVSNSFGTAGKEVYVVPGAIGSIEGTSSVILDLDSTFVTFVYISSGTNWKLEQTPAGPTSGSVGLTNFNSRVISRATTTSAAATPLTFDGGLPTANNQLVLPNNSTFTFSILVTARRTDQIGESAGYKLEGVISRNSLAGTTVLIGTPIKTVLGETTAAWDCNVSADLSNGGLAIIAIGELNKTIKWVSVCNTAEVLF